MFRKKPQMVLTTEERQSFIEGRCDPSDRIPAVSRKSGELLFLTPAQFEENFGIAYRSHLHFSSEKILSDVFYRSEKNIATSQAHAMNRWTRALIERQKKAQRTAPGAVKWINKELGYGVFAYADIPQYAYIGEYVGYVRKRAMRRDHFNSYIFRYVTGTRLSPYIIDARDMGNFTRFINHSDTPNVASRWIVLGKITHIIFFANTLIKKGAQLTYDYGENYWYSRRCPKPL